MAETSVDAIGEVLPSDDPLDRADFDAIVYINQHFPTESSIKRLEPFVQRVNNNITQLDEEISCAVQAQAEAGERAAKDITEAKEAIHELHSKIKDIKSKADQSELMVQEICRDIKQLDYAKRHLQTTITALKRLHMLVTAVNQLQVMAEEKHYREAANLLHAVSQLLTHFEPYADIARIKELKDTVLTVKKDLTVEILDAFHHVKVLAQSVADTSGFEDKSSQKGEFASLPEACLVVDALGEEAVEKQIGEIVKDTLQPYETMPEFRMGGDAASLDQMDRRFSWFRRTLREMETRFENIFPKHWNVSKHLCIGFFTLTREQLLQIMTSGDAEVENVTVLLKALQKSLAFEKEMKNKFNPSKDSKDPRRLSSASQATNSNDSDDEKVYNLISSAFDAFMGPYISLERKNMEEVMLKYIQEEQVGQDGALPVYTSSVQMFGYIKGSIKRCTALTSGQTFYDLHKEFKAVLNQYGDILRQKLTSNDKAGKGVVPASESPEKDMCYVVNTAEYCADTIPQLEDLIKSKIDDVYAEKVCLTSEQDVFFDVIATSIRSLVSGLESQAEVAFRAMMSINWGAFDMVGEESGYVRTINAAVFKYIPNCRSILSSLYFRNFCDKFAASFCPAFLNLIQKQRRISEEGTQQLLLDLYNLKKMMLDLPRIGTEPGIDHEINVPISYRKYVEKHMSKVERLLKLVATPVSMLVEHFRMMWPDGGNKELQIVMSLKGMKRTEQLTVLETFGGGSSAGSSATTSTTASTASGASATTETEEDGDLKARAMKGMKGAMDDFQKISSGMKTAFR